MIRKCTTTDTNRIYDIVNTAARAYDGVIADDCYHQPYMPKEELEQEMKRVHFYGWENDGDIVGVMGIEPVKDVTLIRHAYVLPDYQDRGIGRKLLEHLIELTSTPQLLVGTWKDATWAVRFYENNGFELLPEKDKLLADYWDIPQKQIETSVVLGVKINND
jgi:N-acetylglutamate synthase-like GNAT family acetyltransferase